MSQTDVIEVLPNYAGRSDVDDDLVLELEQADIKIETLPEVCRNTYGEVKTIILGTLHGWSFNRAWRYWICEGPGIPVESALQLHKEFGQKVRVDGSCTCPSPLDRFKGLGAGFYHVDTLRGLKALADTIRGVVEGDKVIVFDESSKYFKKS